MRLSIALGACLIAGCGTSPPTRFFTLDATAPPIHREAHGAPVEVNAVHVPPTLDRQTIVRGEIDHQLTISSQDRWGADFGELVRRVLTQDLEARLPAGMVLPPDTPAPDNARGLVVEILAFQPKGSDIVLDADWTLLEGAPARPALQRSVHLQEAAGSSTNDQVAAMSRLLGQLADRIAEEIARN
ncbi:MAG: PqiC family protein [Steroidobacteraceae bacterium]